MRNVKQIYRQLHLNKQVNYATFACFTFDKKTTEFEKLHGTKKIDYLAYMITGYHFSNWPR